MGHFGQWSLKWGRVAEHSGVLRTQQDSCPSEPRAAVPACTEVGEMAQQLRAPTTLPENQGDSQHLVALNQICIQFQEVNRLSDLCGGSGTHTVHRHSYRQNTHKIKNWIDPIFKNKDLHCRSFQLNLLKSIPEGISYYPPRGRWRCISCYPSRMKDSYTEPL